MSHGLINERITPAKTGVAYTIYRNAACTPYYESYSTTYPSGGIGTWKYRTASVHTTKDQFGWRPPAAYWAKTIKTDLFMYEDTWYEKSGTCGFNPPSLERCPIPGISSSNCFHYSYAYANTPFNRLGGLAATNLRNWDKARAIAKLNSSDFSLGVTLGETRETYRMVVGALRDIRTFLRMAKRGEIHGIAKLLKKYDPFSVYLQWRYGWSQLYRDIWNGVKLIEELDNGTYKRYRLFVKSKTKYNYHIPKHKMSSATSYEIHNWLEGAELCKSRFDFYLNNQDYVYLSALGLQPLPTIWELLPWSFVADWFLNIGTFLEAWTVKEGWTYLAGSQTLVGDWTEFAQFSQGSDKSYRVHSRPMTNSIFEMHRYAGVNPNVTLALNPQLLNGMISRLRIADAVSLVAQQLKRF
jgi:hypothetical protein